METVKYYLKIVALLVVCGGIPFIAWALVRIAQGTYLPGQPQNPTYAELIAIILTAVTVVLAVLAVVVAVLAIWGYSSIKKEAAGAASQAIAENVASLVQKHTSEAAIIALIRKEVTRTIGNLADNYSEAYDDVPPEPPQPPLGPEYPKGDGNEG